MRRRETTADQAWSARSLPVQLGSFGVESIGPRASRGWEPTRSDSPTSTSVADDRDEHAPVHPDRAGNRVDVDVDRRRDQLQSPTSPVSSAASRSATAIRGSRRHRHGRRAEATARAWRAGSRAFGRRCMGSTTTAEPVRWPTGHDRWSASRMAARRRPAMSSRARSCAGTLERRGPLDLTDRPTARSSGSRVEKAPESGSTIGEVTHRNLGPLPDGPVANGPLPDRLTWGLSGDREPPRSVHRPADPDAGSANDLKSDSLHRLTPDCDRRNRDRGPYRYRYRGQAVSRARLAGSSRSAPS